MNSDLNAHHIEGYARAALERGLDGKFSVPLISQVDENLWVGGCVDGVKLPENFRYVLSLYQWERYELPVGCNRVEVQMYDASEIPDEPLLYGLANLAGVFAENGRTLVHCQAGLNRSNLIAGLMLIKVKEMKPEDAIAKLREKRCDVVLCNQTFESWLLKQ